LREHYSIDDLSLLRKDDCLWVGFLRKPFYLSIKSVCLLRIKYGRHIKLDDSARSDFLKSEDVVSLRTTAVTAKRKSLPAESSVTSSAIDSALKLQPPSINTNVLGNKLQKIPE
jgi:hypothetical protein